MANDLNSLCSLLGSLVDAAGGSSSREVETAMGVGHGRLRDVLSGRLSLRVSHLLGLARLLDLAPSEILALGCPESERTARRSIAEWLGPRTPRFAKEAADAELTPELEARFRAIAREEIEAAETRRRGA